MLAYSTQFHMMYAQHEISSASDWSMKALDIEQKLGNEQGVSRCYLQLGSIALSQMNLDMAKDWCMKAMNIALKQSDERTLSNVYRILGTITREGIGD